MIAAGVVPVAITCTTSKASSYIAGRPVRTRVVAGSLDKRKAMSPPLTSRTPFGGWMVAVLLGATISTRWTGEVGVDGNWLAV